MPAMIESLIAFREAYNENSDLQEKIKAGADLVELKKLVDLRYDDESLHL